MFIGRENELSILKSRLNSPNYELGIIYGQRRIGKTSLIIEATKEFDSLYFLSRDDSYQNNLSYFSDVYRQYLNLPYSPSFKTFDELFNTIVESSKKKLVIVIDELPFLAKSYPGILSYLQLLCDKLKRENRDIKIVLSGSDMSFMMDLLNNKAKPLYQRSTFKIHVLPMLFSDAAKMLDGINNIDTIKYLSIFGNRPYYLDKIDKNKTFEDNIISLCFDDGSILLDAPNLTLPLGYVTNSTYIAILVALANHKNRVKEISDQLHIADNALSIYLSRMLEGGSIEKRTMFKGSQRTNYYEISDPFIRFYYRVMYMSLMDIERGLGESVYKTKQTIIEDIINHGFEDAVISYLDELNRNNNLPNTYHSFQKYKVDNSKLGRSIEIDALSDSLDGTSLLAVEAKFKNKNLSLQVLEHLKENVSLFAKNFKNVDYYLFSKSSFGNDLLNLKDNNVHLISLETMLIKR